MSLGNRTDPDAAAQDEDDWAARDDDAVLTSHDVQTAVAPPASSNGQVDASTDDQNEDTRAADLAVLGDACPICLQTLEDPVMLTACYHVYCFECLSTWVHSLVLHGVEPPTCPLCKASFQEVYANVRSETDFELFRFSGRRIQDQGDRNRQRDNDSNRQRLRRRSLVYRRHMRLVRVAGKEVEDGHTLPKMHKDKGEYEVWMERELRACIGRDIDLTVLVAIIQCCLNKIGQCGAKKCYDELQQALTPFLYEDAAHFVRELAYFLGSRLNLEAYDAAVEYRCENAAECTNALCCASR
ncbi:E3 ubiquitin-protein ligase Topors [Phytophthora citrophthora]|uniref:RING-type E3 ubiquitin transferase n=1 Tax=Phytophthora citrophthora TaxID=4793 RepID=A0AAD9LG59_9STRA|nr:E3 ubiquitin-protein ligase Topors [Phytophthora citrophthora]